MNHATTHGELKPVQPMFFALTNDCSPKTYTKGQNTLAPIYQEVIPRGTSIYGDLQAKNQENGKEISSVFER